jgi:hypothetical protein
MVIDLEAEAPRRLTARSLPQAPLRLHLRRVAGPFNPDGDNHCENGTEESRGGRAMAPTAGFAIPGICWLDRQPLSKCQ